MGPTRDHLYDVAHVKVVKSTFTWATSENVTGKLDCTTSFVQCDDLIVLILQIWICTFE